jgi:hypothetical protein
MKVAREAAERRAIQLEAEVSRLKKDLDRIRSSYANLYLESHSSIERLRRMELRAAQMLRQKEGGELEKVSEEALEALEKMRESGESIALLYQLRNRKSQQRLSCMPEGKSLWP